MMTKRLTRRLRSTLLCLLCTTPVLAAPPSQVVTLGGTVTEIVYQLGLGEKLIGTDLSSLYPAAATELPRVGYYRSTPLEGLLSLKPDTILASEQAGPPQVLDRIAALGIPVKMIDDQASLNSLYKRIEQIAQVFEVPEAGQQLQHQIREQLAQIQPVDQNIKALVLMSHSTQMQGAGANTAPDLLLSLAGMSNVLNQQNGYKAISNEAIAALAPDVIVLTGSAVLAASPPEHPSLHLTPAARYDSIGTIDPLLMLGIGPRIGESLHLLIQLRDQALSHIAPSLSALDS